MESNSGLFLETDSYLNNVLDIEFEKDKEALLTISAATDCPFFSNRAFFI